MSSRTSDNLSAIKALGIADLPPRARLSAQRDAKALARLDAGAACANAPEADVLVLTGAETQAEAADVAERYCRSCPVRVACLESGRAGHEWGVRGGVVLRDGWVAALKANPGRPAPEPVAVAERVEPEPVPVVTTPCRGQRVQPRRARSRKARRRRVAA